MTNLDGCVITFPIVSGIFGVGRLATRLKALADTGQIGRWHIGQWIDFKYTAIRMRFSSVADGERAQENSHRRNELSSPAPRWLSTSLRPPGRAKAHPSPRLLVRV
jgi:hypothetical protein